MENELFEKAPIRKAYFTMALPVVFGMVVSLVYNMVDTYFIAATGNTDLVAGVSIGAPVFTLMIALGDIFGLGGSSVISRMFGQKKDADAKRMSVFCFYAAIICGILVTVIMLLLRQPVLQLLGADSDTMVYASEYYTGISIGAAGAATATVIGYICSDFYFLRILMKKSKKLSVNPKGFHITVQEMKPIFAIGIPASITNLMQSISMALTNRMLLAYGNEKVAAMGIVMKVNMIAALILVGFAFGAQPLIGYNYGAGNKKRLKKILAFCYSFECGLALAFAVILSIAARPMIGLFMNQEEIVAAGVPMLRFQQLGMVFMAIVLVTTCVFQSAGKALGAFLLSVSRQGVIFAVVMVIASKTVGYMGVISTQPISDFLTAVLAVLLFVGYFKGEFLDRQQQK